MRSGKWSKNLSFTGAEKIAAEGRKEFDKASAKLGEKVREVISSYSDGKHLEKIRELEARIAALEHKHKPAGG